MPHVDTPAFKMSKMNNLAYLLQPQCFLLTNTRCICERRIYFHMRSNTFGRISLRFFDRSPGDNESRLPTITPLRSTGGRAIPGLISSPWDRTPTVSEMKAARWQETTKTLRANEISLGRSSRVNEIPLFTYFMCQKLKILVHYWNYPVH